MKEYPHIEYWNKGIQGSPIIAFDKLDGQNIRCEWSKNRGWYKFGSKKSMFDETHSEFGKVIPVFKEKYGDALTEVFKRNKLYRNTRNFVVFCEWVGENSFCGRHDPNDKMDIVLFDIAPGDYTNQGFMEPKEFVKEFGHLHIPRIVYQGNLNMSFVNDVKAGKYRVKEGVMCKGVQQNQGRKVWVVKIKTNEWLDRLRGDLGEDALREELNGDLSLM